MVSLEFRLAGKPRQYAALDEAIRTTQFIRNECVEDGQMAQEDQTVSGVQTARRRKGDVERLHELGYAQELLRSMGGFSNFAVSFTIISILSGCLTLYGFGLNTGGPIVMSIGWAVVGVMVIVVGLAMENAPAWSWFTGWFNLLGQVGVTAGIDFGLAFFVTAELNLVFGYPTDPPHVILVYAVVLFLHGLLNTFGVRLVAFLNDVSVWWHILGVLIIVAALALIPAHHQSAAFVFTRLVNNTGLNFPGAGIYVFLIGLLLAQYTFTGYDASAHMTEETREADVAAPWGIVMSIVVSLIAGWILLLGVTFAIQNYNAEVTSPTGVPPAQIFIDAVGRVGGELLMFIVIGAQFFCGMASVTANSRMIYAFSRDGALPGSRFWHKINKRTRTPTNSIWLAAVAAWLLVAPAYWRGSVVAYFAVTSIAVIGLYIAYVIPTFLRLIAGEKFKRGPWHLGRWSYVVG